MKNEKCPTDVTYQLQFSCDQIDVHIAFYVGLHFQCIEFFLATVQLFFQVNYNCAALCFCVRVFLVQRWEFIYNCLCMLLDALVCLSIKSHNSHPSQ